MTQDIGYMGEIIICDTCKGEDCKVTEVHNKLTMGEYVLKYYFKYSEKEERQIKQMIDEGTKRRFLITCQDCGYEIEFTQETLPSLWEYGK